MNGDGEAPETPHVAPQQDVRPLTALSLVLVSMLLIFGVGFLLALWVRRPGTPPDARAVIFAAEWLLLIPELGYLRWKKLSLVRVFRLNPVPVSLIAAAVVLTIGLVPLTDALDRLIEVWIPMPKDMEEMLKLSFDFHNPLFFYVAFFSATLFAGTFEEMLFRGFFQGVWERNFSAGWAIGISATLFALVHLNPWWLVQILILGILLGYIAFRSQSVIPGIFVHVLNNMIALFFLNLPEKGKNWYAVDGTVRWYWLALGIVLFAGAWTRMEKIWNRGKCKEVLQEWK